MLKLADMNMQMKKTVLRAVIATVVIGATLALAGCDSGKIYPQEDPSGSTRSLTVRGTFTGTASLPYTDKERKLMFFAYSDGSGTPVRSSRISTALAEGAEDSLTVSLIPQPAGSFVLAITRRDNSIIYELCSGRYEAGEGNASASVGSVNLLRYERLQQQLYEQSCTACHGSANQSAGLSLSSGASYRNTVNKEATRSVKGTMIVPGSADESVMYQRLTTEGDFHATLTNLKPNDVTLLEEWINAGASAE